MAKYKIKEKPAMDGLMEKDVDGIKKQLLNVVLMHQAVKKGRSKKGALGE